MSLRLPKIKSLFGWLLFSVVALGFGGLILFFAALFTTGLAGQGIGLWRMQHWTGQTTGIVQSVTVVDGSGRRNTSATNISYTYTVDGHPFIGTRIGPEWEWVSGTETGGGSVAKAFSQGQSVPVHYNPAQPQDAFLWAKMKKSALGFPLFLLLIFALGYSSVRQRKKQTDDRRWLIATTLAGLGGGGAALLFAFPTYAEPAHVAWVLGGGMALGLAWGLFRRTQDLREAASNVGTLRGMRAEVQLPAGIVTEHGFVQWRWWNWRSDLFGCCFLIFFSCLAPAILWPIFYPLKWPQTTGNWIATLILAGVLCLFTLMPWLHTLSLIFNTTIAKIEDDTLVITTSPFGRFWGKRIVLSEVAELETTTKRTGKSGWTYTLLAKRSHGKSIKLLKCDGNDKRLAGQVAVRTMVEDWLKRK